ncbi:MAG: DUF2961 domain-containing protein [Bacteroidetes bacterium]|nr:MAG: DUF2961 domain-containing protein [Bacteroidota bacterium]
MAFAIGCGPAPQAATQGTSAQMYTYSDAMEPRWISFENPTGAKGAGGKENAGAKGHPYDQVKAGATQTLLDLQGPGVINRIWLTINERSPQMLRGLVLNMYWDGESKPAVSVPLGDFFSVGLGRMTVFENEFFYNPEGRSFNCNIQMPFRKSAKVELVNESGKDLAMLFYDIDVQLLKQWDEKNLYFHAYWHRDTATTLGKDFEILPQVRGKGRFLGSHVGVNANPLYKKTWFGEGEVKMYLDGDAEYPTLIGTGTEDYIGTAWGQGAYTGRYTGCTVADEKKLQWAFYRFHVPDPVFFKTDCRVTIQQIGGGMKPEILAMQKAGVPLIPVTVQDEAGLVPLYTPGKSADLSDPALPNGWVNYYRSDDLSATAYFYHEKPSSELPALQPVALRAAALRAD